VNNSFEMVNEHILFESEADAISLIQKKIELPAAPKDTAPPAAYLK
jgi:hypothetical protein